MYKILGWTQAWAKSDGVDQTQRHEGVYTLTIQIKEYAKISPSSRPMTCNQSSWQA
jgi:hypothetical protein